MLTCREETFRSLRCAVEGWEGAWHERQRAGATVTPDVRQCSRPLTSRSLCLPQSLDACFLDVAASYQQMQLTASLCQLHSQVLDPVYWGPHVTCRVRYWGPHVTCTARFIFKTHNFHGFEDSL